ncbi:chloride channel protein [Neisseriaceae bacterium JH1-16]|nr:chloride channel protein [Neisseriaceae bacterium JH1-16]
MNHQRDFALAPGQARLTALALAIGVLATGGAWLLLTLIRLFTNLFFYQTLSIAARSPAGHALGLAVIAVPVLGGLIVGLMARYGSDKIRGHGIPEALEAILFGKSKMSAKVAILKPLSSGIVIGSGGPFGAEGPIIMTGGAIGSLLAQQFHLTAAERKTLLVAGAAAGMTAVFGTPLAAILLAVELLLFELRPRSLVPVALAAAVAAFMRPLLIDSGPLFPLATVVPSFDALPISVLAGLLAGALAATLSAALYKVEDAFHRLPLHWMWWPALGGLAVGIGGYFEPRALGVGYDVIGDLLNGHLALGIVAGLLLVKCVIWVIALGSGTSGGVLAPLLMMGAGLGTLLAALFPGSHAALWPLVAMAAMLSGTLGAPLTAAAFALELTHDVNALLPVLLACTVAYALTVRVMRRSILTEKIARRGRHIFREYAVDPLERSHADELMSRELVTLPAATTLAEAAQQFGPGRHRAYPVLDGARYLGLLDEVTLVHLAAAHPADTPLSTLLDAAGQPFALPGDSGRVLASRLASQGLERLAVRDGVDGRLLGLITRSDLLKTALAFHAEEQHAERHALWRRPGTGQGIRPAD